MECLYIMVYEEGPKSIKVTFTKTWNFVVSFCLGRTDAERHEHQKLLSSRSTQVKSIWSVLRGHATLCVFSIAIVRDGRRRDKMFKAKYFQTTPHFREIFLQTSFGQGVEGLRIICRVWLRGFGSYGDKCLPISDNYLHYSRVTYIGTVLLGTINCWQHRTIGAWRPRRRGREGRERKWGCQFCVHVTLRALCFP
jgi:hypothetical protein